MKNWGLAPWINWHIWKKNVIYNNWQWILSTMFVRLGNGGTFISWILVNARFMPASWFTKDNLCEKTGSPVCRSRLCMQIIILGQSHAKHSLSCCWEWSRGWPLRPPTCSVMWTVYALAAAGWTKDSLCQSQ